MWRFEQLALSWAANAITLCVATIALGDVTADGAGDLLVAAAVFAVLNTFVKPILKLLTLPLAAITLGVAWFFVAALMLLITEAIVGGFEIDGFEALVLATIIVWLVNLILDVIPGPWRGTRRDRSIFVRTAEK